MDASDQILKLYETGATAEVIARAMDMDGEMVKTILYSKSANYRRTLKTIEPGTSVADEMLSIMSDLARNSANEFIKLNAAKTVRDDLKGRRDVVAVDAGINTEILLTIGQRLEALADKRQKFLANRPADVIIDA